MDVKGARVLAERIEQEKRRRAARSRGEGERVDSPPPLESGGRWNYRRLLDLVEGAADRFPDDVEDWTTFLDGLQGQVEEDGFLPARLDPRVTKALRELLLASGHALTR